jgi:hypothetical protein
VNWKRLDKGNVISRLRGDPAERKVRAAEAAGETPFPDHADSSGEAWKAKDRGITMASWNRFHPHSHRARRAGRAQRLGKKSREPAICDLRRRLWLSADCVEKLWSEQVRAAWARRDLRHAPAEIDRNVSAKRAGTAGCLISYRVLATIGPTIVACC